MSLSPSNKEYPKTAYALSLVAGILIIVSGSMAAFWAYNWVTMWDGTAPPWMERIPSNETMHPWRESVSSNVIAFGRTVFFAMAALSLVSGIIIVIAALLLHSRPEDHTVWGVLILVFSILSFSGMGGFLVGAVIGIVGGAMSLSWKSG